MKTRTRRRSAFTLVEILVVIAIIGVLVGLLVPAVMYAAKTVRKRAIAMETNTLADAFNKYQQKFNDLPPDGSSFAVVQRHLLKLFPQIASSEFNLLRGDTFPGTPHLLVNNYSASVQLDPPQGLGVMDPAEAVVFFLGGYSEDPQYPLSGAGGPFFIMGREVQSGPLTQVTSGAPKSLRETVQYNPARNNPFFDFETGQLSTVEVDGLIRSNDESELLQRATELNDMLPVYKTSKKDSPYVYFDHRTYSVPTSSGRYFSHYTTPDHGVARPYKSSQRNTRVPNTPANADDYFQYMNEDSFQLICAGLDDSFGGVVYTGNTGGPVFFEYSSGRSIDFAAFPSGAPAVSNIPKYFADGTIFQLDNVTNFSDAELEYALNN